MAPNPPEMRDSNIQASFLKRLPIEIRIEVYRNPLSAQYTKHPSFSQHSPYNGKLWPCHIYHLDPTILRTSRQVHSEASTVLYGENLLVRIRSTNTGLGRLLSMKGVPVFLEGRKAETFRHCAISVNIDRLNSTNEQQSNSCYVIASDDLQLLCQGLCAQDAFVGNIFRTCEIKITIHRMFDDMLTKNPASASPQRRLLEPFTDLHSVPHFEIAGPANTEYCASIAAQVSRVAPTEEECFNKVLELSDRGYEKSSRNDLEGAVKFYKMAFCHLVSTCLLARTLRTNPTEFFPGRQRSLWDTYQTLQANLALVHYWLDEFEDAH